MKLDEDLLLKMAMQSALEKGDAVDLKVRDGLRIDILTNENKKLKEKVDDLEKKLDIANTMGGMLMKHNFRLMQECRDAGHGEIVDKFLDELRKELEK